jgi:hypothetical protein
MRHVEEEPEEAGGEDDPGLADPESQEQPEDDGADDGGGPVGDGFAGEDGDGAGERPGCGGCIFLRPMLSPKWPKIRAPNGCAT